MEEGYHTCHQDMSIHGHVRIKHAAQVLDMRCWEYVSNADPDVGDVDLLQLLTCANDEELCLIIVDQQSILYHPRSNVTETRLHHCNSFFCTCTIVRLK